MSNILTTRLVDTARSRQLDPKASCQRLTRHPVVKAFQYSHDARGDLPCLQTKKVYCLYNCLLKYTRRSRNCAPICATSYAHLPLLAGQSSSSNDNHRMRHLKLSTGGFTGLPCAYKTKSDALLVSEALRLTPRKTSMTQSSHHGCAEVFPPETRLYHESGCA